MANTTHFGFRTVEEGEKQRLVRGVFDSVANKYDLMNDLMSAGLHRLWKQEMVRWLAPRAHWRVLDVAGGTGDIAQRIREQSGCEVVVCDINYHMLHEGVDRAIDRNQQAGLSWVCGNAQALPVPDNSMDAYTIAFGIRNVTHIDVALREALRVLKPGGRFLCLEFSHMTLPPLQKLYDMYSFAAIPRIGGWVTGDKDSYQYLVESIRRFPLQDDFAQMMRDAGFEQVQYRNLTGGVVALHSGRKI
jgi:demethylmenaquinone methyltransferase / 2-methoxy-6-polyprenyl-1,4-benzoquinol methylase